MINKTTLLSCIKQILIYIATGMVCGVTNCPVASILLAAELFSGKVLGFIAIATLLCFCLSGKSAFTPPKKPVALKIGFNPKESLINQETGTRFLRSGFSFSFSIHVKNLNPFSLNHRNLRFG